MSARTRFTRSASLVAVAAVTVLAAPSAVADGVPLVSLGDGSGDADVTVVVFDSVVVPGDLVVRDFQIRNDGPTDGTLTVDIVDVTLTGELDQFFHDITLNGMTFAALNTGETRLHELHMEPDEIVTVPLGVDFPWEAISGNRSQVGERAAAFQMRLTISGDTPGSTPTPGPDPAPGTDPERPAQTQPPVRAGGAISMPRTGPDIVTTLALALVLGSAGLVARLAYRRATPTNDAGEL